MTLKNFNNLLKLKVFLHLPLFYSAIIFQMLILAWKSNDSNFNLRVFGKIEKRSVLSKEKSLL